jgi:hypothetical protein
MLNLENAALKPRKRVFQMKFGGLNDGAKGQKYPTMMYCDGKEPIVIQNTADEDDARQNGYDAIIANQMCNRHLVNWFWDLEDLSPKQLIVFAQDEYGIDLPAEASQEKLFQCVLALSKAAPQNRNRIVLMAHTIKMNYDETLAEITRTMDNPSKDDELTTETWEITA